MRVKSKFKVKDEVIQCRQSPFGGTRYGRVDTVAKIYLNGNFTLKSNPKQQWRPTGAGDYASPTGADHYGSVVYVRLYDEKAKAAIEAIQQSVANRVRGQELERRLRAIHPIKLAQHDEAVVALLQLLEEK